MSILLVEQNAEKALEVADCAYVLSGGRMAVEGEAAGLLNDEAVLRSYLGRATVSPSVQATTIERE